jgi:hypothetical protein
MKKLILLLFIAVQSFGAFAQVDTSTAEKKARYKISLIRDNTVRAITPAVFRNALYNIVDLAVTPGAVETDPTVTGTVKAITSGNVTNWNTAYGWGNHASAGYYTLSSSIPWTQITGAPTIPTNFLDLTTAQSAGGNKTFTGTTTLGLATLTGDITPTADNVVTIGVISKMLKNTFSLKVTAQSIQQYNTTGLSFLTSPGVVVGQFANSGNFMLQGGGSFADSGERLQVTGTAKLTGKITAGAGINAAALPTYADNAAATTGGLVVGDFYKTSTGVLMIRY